MLVMSSLDRAVRIPQAIMSLLKIQIGDHLNARVENGSLILTPENEEPTLESFLPLMTDLTIKLFSVPKLQMGKRYSRRERGS